MNDNNFQHLCTLILGVATLFRFIGYDIATFIVESLLHSAHVRDPEAILNHAGYYGQAVKEISTSLSTLIVPIFLHFISPKWTLVIGSAMFTFYFASFFFINNCLFFFANIFLGVASALTFTSFYSCQMIFSTKETLARNSVRIQGIASLSLITGGLLYIYITKTHADPSVTHYRYYSESETRTMCIFLLAFCIANLLLTCGLPTREVATTTYLQPFVSFQIDNSVSSENFQSKMGSLHLLKVTVSTLIDYRILLFVPRFINHGLLISFFMNVYPTSLQYSGIIAKQYPMITAYYAFAMCAGTTFCGLIVAPLNRCFRDFGFRPLFFVAIGTQFFAYCLAVITVPNFSTIRPSTESALFEPNLLWVCLIAFLLGFADSSHVASGAVLGSRLLPGRFAHVYSASRFYRGIGASIVFFCSPILTMRAHAAILISITLITALTFEFAVKHIENRDQEEEEECTSQSNT